MVKRNDLDDFDRDPLLDYTRDEETSAELSSLDTRDLEQTDDEVINDTQVGSIVGWIALIVSVLSFFMMPIVFGVGGIIVGIVARARGAQWLGNIAIGLGIISLVARLFIVPFF